MKRRGTGYAAIFYGTGYGNGFPDESRAIARLYENGQINVFVGAADVGQGGVSTMWQIAVETLGLSKELVTVCNDNTEIMKDSGTAAASRQTYNTGNAVYNACKKLKESMQQACRDADKNYEEIKTQEIYRLMLAGDYETAEEGYFKADTTKVDLETGQGNPYWPYTFGTQKAMVEVDDETGKVDVIELVTVNDGGRIINPVLAEGQAHGGCAMGIGYALMEEVELDKGDIRNRNFSDYIIPTSMDVPRITTYFIEEIEESGPYGAKGIGEAVMIPTAPAILNAIYNAVGVRLYELPATCDRVLRAIK